MTNVFTQYVILLNVLKPRVIVPVVFMLFILMPIVTTPNVIMLNVVASSVPILPLIEAFYCLEGGADCVSG